MKKILMALLLVFALCAVLIGCGEKKDGADYLFESLENMESSLSVISAEELAKTPWKATLSVADVSAICELLGVDLGGIPLGAASVALTSSEKTASGEIAVNVDGKDLTLDIFADDANNFVLASEQLSANYGGTVNDFFAIVSELSGMDIGAMLAEMPAMPDAETIEALDARYEELLETLVRDNIAFTVEKEGKNVIVSCELTPANVAAVGSTLIAEMQKDEDMLALMQATNGAVAVAELKEMSADKDTIHAELVETGFSGTLRLTAVEKTSELIALDVDLVTEDVPVALDITQSEDTFGLVMEVEDIQTELSAKVTADAAAIALKGYEAGETVLDITLDIAEDIEIAVTAEGEKIGIHFDCTETANTYEMLLDKINVGGIGLDLSEFSIKLTVESGVAAPVLPTEYSSIAGYTAENLQGILMEFVINAGLLAYMW